MNEQELINKLNKIIVGAECDRIMAERRGDLKNEERCRAFRCSVEEMRDTIAVGNCDEEIKEQAIQIIAQHLMTDRIRLQKQGIEVGKPKNFLFYIVDKIFGKSKKLKEEENNPIKK